MFSVAKLLPVQRSVLGRYDKQMLEMPVAGRWSGIKPRRSDYQPAGNQSRPRKGFCVGLAATGSTACNANVIQKTRRRKKALPKIALIGSQRRFPVKWKNSSTVLFSALKLKQVGNETNERLSAQGLPANQREAVSLFRGNGRPARELKILTVFIDRFSIVTAPLVLMLESLMGANLIT